MLWMQTYLFYCSVRLGVIVVASTTLLQVIIPGILILVFGIELLEPVANLFKNDDYYKKTFIISKALNWMDNHPQNLMVLVETTLFFHAAACVLAMYGAFRLLKYFLLPLIIFDFLRVVCSCLFHIILMIVLKKQINLGILVAFTLLGSFIILYLAYNWCSCVALFQIINLIHCNRYRELYGDDPFCPQMNNMANNLSKQYSYSTIENVHVLTTPNGNDIDKLKQKNHDAAMLQQRSVRKNGIIAVLPANYQSNAQLPILLGDGNRFKERSRKWWQDIKPSNRSLQKSVAQSNTYDDTFTANYDAWQWSKKKVSGPKNANKF